MGYWGFGASGLWMRFSKGSCNSLPGLQSHLHLGYAYSGYTFPGLWFLEPISFAQQHGG